MKQFITILAALFVAIPAAFAQRFIRAVDSLATLNATPTSSNSPDIYVTGANGGFFRWTAGSSAATNAYNVLANPYGSGVGRWIRQQATGGTINLGAAGLTFDGGTYDYPFIAQNMSSVGIDGTTAQLTGLTDLTLDGQRDLTIFGRTNFYLWTPRVWNQTAPNNATLRLIDSTTGKADFVLMDVESVAALKSVPASFYANGATFRTLGYYSAGDGGHGVYRYDSASAATADDGLVIAPTHGTGRFLLIHDKVASLRQFGGRGDGSSNDTTPLQNAVTALNAGSIEKLRVPVGRFVLRDDFILTGSNIVIEGDGPDSVLGSAQTDGTNNNLFDIRGTNIVFDKIYATRLRNTNITQGIADNLFDIKATVRNFTFKNGVIDGGMTNQVTGRVGYFFREFRASGWTSTNYYPSGIFIQDNYFTDTGSRSIDLRGVQNVKITGNFGTFCGINIPPYAPATNKPLGTFIEIQSYDTSGQVNWSTNVTIANNVCAFWGDGFINTGGTADMSIVGNVGISAYAMGLDRDTYINPALLLPSVQQGENGISLFGGKRTTITGNTVAYTGQQAFQIRTEEAGMTYFKDLHDIVIANNSAVAGVDQRGDLLEANYAIYGINTNTSARNISFVGNVHRSFAATGGALSIQMDNGASVVGVAIVGNAFYGGTNAGTAHRAISFSSTGSGTAAGISITGNTIQNYGIGFYSPGSWPSDTTRFNNSFVGVATIDNNPGTSALASGDGFISIRGTGFAGPAAQAGQVRLPNTGTISWRNAANSGNVTGITVDASDAVVVGTRFSVNPSTASIAIMSTGLLTIGQASNQALNAGATLTVASTGHRVSGSGGAVTLAANALSAGSNGQIVYLVGTDDTNTVTINDGGNMFLQANRTLGNGDILVLMYTTAGSAGWREVSYSNN